MFPFSDAAVAPIAFALNVSQRYKCIQEGGVVIYIHSAVGKTTVVNHMEWVDCFGVCVSSSLACEYSFSATDNEQIRYYGCLPIHNKDGRVLHLRMHQTGVLAITRTCAPSSSD